MNHANGSAEADTPQRGGAWRMAVFPLAVLILYAVLYLIMPDRTLRALMASAQILIQVALPLCVAFVLMVLLNLFVKPAHVSRFLGSGAGLKGVGISTLAGMISTGPIYAWYPLLKDLRERGASDFHIANFLGNRAVKPFLLPVMVFYFGWGYTAVLNLLLIFGAILIAAIVSLPGERPQMRQ
ncbi:MAG: permease [Armatimonadota bacterium]